MGIIKTVLAILKHQNEFFFIIRQNNLRVFPGYASFPGGKVDRRETAWEAFNEDPLLMGALKRELIEELGLDLAKACESGLVKEMRFIGEAITPDFNPYRFDAKYALIELEERPNFKLDKKEIAKGFWTTFKEFEKMYLRGELIVIPPVWRIRDYLNDPGPEYQTFNLPLLKDQVPVIESIFGVKQIMPLSNTLPPATRTNAFLIGGVLVDPSPKDEAELENFLNTIKNEKTCRR
jgi:8-oxo-dGTP pyrophosphatase MutT (NUDIX family)